MFSALPFTHTLRALDYPYATPEPQGSGWPLCDEEWGYVCMPEYLRVPGAFEHQHLPHLWPVTPNAGTWTSGAMKWVERHQKLVLDAQSKSGPLDVLLLGDSITQGWGGQFGAEFNEAWRAHFQKYKAANLGVSGDKTQHLLWRLDHGVVDGLDPRLVVMLIGNNNIHSASQTGIDSIAQGVQLCVANVREKFPDAHLLLVMILPAKEPSDRFYKNVKKTNRAIRELNLDNDPKVQLMDLTAEMLESDGAIKANLFRDDREHLHDTEGYAFFAEKLEPVLDGILERKIASVKQSQ